MVGGRNDMLGGRKDTEGDRFDPGVVGMTRSVY
jgi:hypothetical protein